MQKRFKLQNVSIKAVKGEPGIVGRVTGHATTYESWENPDSYDEIVAEGAVDPSDPDLKDLPMKNEHEETIGSWQTFSIEKIPGRDVKGLKVEGIIADTSKGREVALLAGPPFNAIKGLSIGFKILEQKELFEHMGSWGWPIVELTKIKLREISLTSNPANLEAQITEVKAERERTHMKSRKRSLKKKSAFSDFTTTAITSATDADEAVTDETINSALAEALSLSEEVVTSMMAGEVLPSTPEQLAIIAGILEVEEADLLAEMRKDMDLFMDAEAEEDDEEDDAEDETEITPEEEAELEALAADLDQMTEDIETL